MLACCGDPRQQLLQADRDLYVDDEPSRDFAVDLAGQQRVRQLTDGALDGVERLEAHTGPGEELPPLLLPPPLAVCLLGVLMANRFGLHRRSLALLAIAEEVLAAPVIGVTGLGHSGGLMTASLFDRDRRFPIVAMI